MAQLDALALPSLRALGSMRTLRSGERLFGQLDGPGPVALIESGRVQISATGEGGVEVPLATRLPGDLIGEFAALDGRPRSATATALGDVDVTMIAAHTFVDWLRARPDVMFTLLVSLVGVIHDTDAARLDLAGGSSSVARRRPGRRTQVGLWNLHPAPGSS